MPLDRCFVLGSLREGEEVTIIAWGGMVVQAMAAAETLAAERVSAEVIDVATLKPLDAVAILRSVVKTGRCIIAQAAP